MDGSTYTKPAHGWTCFHCGETFTTVGGARDHFGAAPDAEPGCLLKVEVGEERGLLMAYRKAEAELARYRAEDSDKDRELDALRADHAQALRREEEKGYERGLRDAGEEAERLRALLNSPVVDDWIEGVRLEAAHQQERWGTDHDAGKTHPDWFWLVGYLAGKALFASMQADVEKAKHHTISTGAALLNWHRHIKGEATRMRPGIEPPALVSEEDCPGHVASAGDPKVCGRCGVHIDSLRPSDDEEF